MSGVAEFFLIFAFFEAAAVYCSGFKYSREEAAMKLQAAAAKR